MQVVRKVLFGVAAAMFVLSSTAAVAGIPKVGVVLMHGKGWSPNDQVLELAQQMSKKGFLVENIEMPWSGRREYDANTSDADAQVDEAIVTLHKKGADKIFVIGHSMGGGYALHYAATHKVDGVIAINPGGNTGNKRLQRKLHRSLKHARKLIAKGKGDEITEFQDFEFSRGKYPIHTTPEHYLSWFSPDGAMNCHNAVLNMNPSTPNLWLEAQDDYKPLRKMNMSMFFDLPSNPHTVLEQPKADHLSAPTASIKTIIDWITSVVIGGSF